MIFLDLIDLAKIRRAILYLFLIVGALWLQLGFFSRIAPLGVRPFFLPAVAVAIGLWEGGVWGAAFGMLTGFLCDQVMIESTVTYLILFSLLGFAAGVLGQFFINRRFLACFLASAAALAIFAGVEVVPVWIFKGAALGDVLPVAELQILWSLPFIIPCYFGAKAIARSN